MVKIFLSINIFIKILNIIHVNIFSSQICGIRKIRSYPRKRKCAELNEEGRGFSVAALIVCTVANPWTERRLQIQFSVTIDLSTAIPAAALVRVTASSCLRLLFLTLSPNTSLPHFSSLFRLYFSFLLVFFKS